MDYQWSVSIRTGAFAGDEAPPVAPKAHARRPAETEDAQSSWCTKRRRTTKEADDAPLKETQTEDADAIQIKVITLSGEEHCLQVSSGETMGEVQMKLPIHLRGEAGTSRFVFGDRVLPNNEKVAKAGLTNGISLHLVRQSLPVFDQCPEGVELLEGGPAERKPVGLKAQVRPATAAQHHFHRNGLTVCAPLGCQRLGFRVGPTTSDERGYRFGVQMQMMPGMVFFSGSNVSRTSGDVVAVDLQVTDTGLRIRHSHNGAWNVFSDVNMNIQGPHEGPRLAVQLPCAEGDVLPSVEICSPDLAFA